MLYFRHTFNTQATFPHFLLTFEVAPCWRWTKLKQFAPLPSICLATCLSSHPTSLSLSLSLSPSLLSLCLSLSQISPVLTEVGQPVSGSVGWRGAEGADGHALDHRLLHQRWAALHSWTGHFLCSRWCMLCIPLVIFQNILCLKFISMYVNTLVWGSNNTSVCIELHATHVTVLVHKMIRRILGLINLSHTLRLIKVTLNQKSFCSTWKP